MHQISAPWALAHHDRAPFRRAAAAPAPAQALVLAFFVLMKRIIRWGSTANRAASQDYI
ncbi:hypothetical protein Thpro_021715 [Acidihalobacter prosperus]|uniref:Uncharacterized protein n=1 Tax=Acidihalobacter prosperus TaxID=160660 RepID=A0A1A6C494_9GAMM|nr:hypothetical protein Thpro_021715 [Acidihalobacter prosperus]